VLLSAGPQEQQAKPAENPEKLTLSKKNAAAEELESLVLALGLDAHRGDSAAEHPSREDLEGYQRAGFGSWLEAQLKTADDSIASVPANIRTFLERRQPTLWRVVGLLERDVPQWESDPRAVPRDLSGALLAASLAKILLAAALAEERAGQHAQAGDLLEATWSLSRSFSGQPDLASQLIAVAMGKLQAGALRKMSEPPVQWLNRMSGVEPWRGMLDAMEAERRYSMQDGDAKLIEVLKKFARASRVVTDRLREISPCDVSKLTAEEIWKPAQDVLNQEQEADGDPSPGVFLSIATPNQTAAIRRAGRLVVDREMTSNSGNQAGRRPRRGRALAGEVLDLESRSAGLLLRVSDPRRRDGDSVHGPDRRWRLSPFGAAPLLRSPGSSADSDANPRAPSHRYSPASCLTPGFSRHNVPALMKMVRRSVTRRWRLEVDR
jgi:hypothetical protein